MKKVLIVFAHPALQKSLVNRRMLAVVEGMKGVTIDDLYERYPDFYIDVKAEQQLLVEHDIIVFQHPFYWYSCPALLKEWLDLTLEYGFAFGEGGDALKGKLALSAITTGGSREAYSREGHNRHEIAELLAPFAQTAMLCGMRYLPPFAVHSVHQLTRPQDIEPHAQRYRRVIEGLRDETIRASQLGDAQRIDEYLSAQDS